jgi:hypothetical protein
MSQVVVKGPLKPDGSLELAEKPALPVGPVEVLIRSLSVPQSGGEDWFRHLQRIRAEREAAGYPFMKEEELNAHIAWLREGDPIDDMLQQVGVQRRQPG